MELVRYGIIGTGYITKTMIAGAKEYPFLRLTAVYSRTMPRAEVFAREVGAEEAALFDDLETMAKSDALDLIYIASPNVCHMEQARLFLQNGKHVLCEKPLSADPAAVEELQSLAAEKGLLFREAIMMLYQPALSILREAVAECGKISVAHFDFCQLSSKYEAYTRGECPNIFNPALHTGALMDLGVYCVYPAITLFGEPESVSATTNFLTTGADGSGAATFHYPDKTVVLTYSKTGQAFFPSAVVGDKGTVTVGSISKLEDIRFHKVGESEKNLYGADAKDVLMGREIASVAEDILRGRPVDAEKDRLALAVSRRMAQIRECAGIEFPGKGE